MRPNVRSSCLLVVCAITLSLFGVLFASLQQTTDAASVVVPLTQMSKPTEVPSTLLTVTPTETPISTGEVPTPVPTVTPPTEWHVEYFRAEDDYLPIGSCVSLAYWVVGAKSLTLTRTSAPNDPVAITDNPNVRSVCPADDPNYVAGAAVGFQLDIVYLDDRTESLNIVVGFY